jgi:SAM-dependent methyltransferase
LANAFFERGDPVGWFEVLYAGAEGNPETIPWADMTANPNLVQWLDARKMTGIGKRALKVGCGLGDDAEELAIRGFDVLAFDISETAINWCRSRFPNSKVQYQVADLFHSPCSWYQAFDLVVESYTLQVLPPAYRMDAMDRISRYVAPGGTLLVISRGRDPDDEPGSMPWPITRRELDGFRGRELREVSFEDYLDNEDPPVRRFRVEYRDPG